MAQSNDEKNNRYEDIGMNLSVQDEKLFIHLLGKTKLLDDSKIEDILQEQSSTGNSLPDILIKKKYASKQDVLKIIAKVKEKPSSKPSRSAPEPKKATSPYSLVRGDKFGPYTICDKLGEGGAGVVYKALDPNDSSKNLALKILFTQDDPTMDEVKLKRIAREFKASQNLHHPNIVSIYEVATCEGALHFVMEFIEGKTLGAIIDKRALSLRESLEILKKTALALDYVHSEGFVHRDIKPENIIITPEKEPKITDLGLAKQMDAKSIVTQAGTIVGSLYYMSPEQIYGSKTDGRSDIYSLGIILYELITGELPFKSTTVGDLLDKMANVDPPHPHTINPEVNTDLELICLKAIEKMPEHRYQKAKEMAIDIERYLDGKPVQARPIGMVGNIGKQIHKQMGFPQQRSRLLLIVVCFILVCVCMFMIYLIFTQLLHK